MRFRSAIGAAVAASAASLLLPAAAGAGVPSGSWGCSAVKVNSYTGYSVCKIVPAGHAQRVRLTCQDGINGDWFIYYGPWVTVSNAKSQYTCGDPARVVLRYVDSDAR
jgi:hypothetical protein